MNFFIPFHPEPWGKMIQFDEHIFQIGPGSATNQPIHFFRGFFSHPSLQKLGLKKGQHRTLRRAAGCETRGAASGKQF